MMHTLEEAEKSCWKYILNKLVHAYNCTRNETTGNSPYYLMFGREPQLPIALILDNPESPVPKNHTDYVKQWEKSMSEAYKVAAKNAEQRKQKTVRDAIVELLWGYLSLVIEYLCAT